MRSVWTGTIGFGPVVIPVKLGVVVSEPDLPLHYFRRTDASRIEMKRFAKSDGTEVSFPDLAKGYEMPDGRVVLLELDDFTLAYGQRDKNAKILYFTPLAQVPPRTAHQQSYYVQPGSGGEQAYALLAQAMLRTGKAGVVSFAVSQREVLGVLYPADDGCLVLERLQWAENIRAADFTVPAADQAAVEMAENLIGLQTQDFDWNSYRDPSMAALNTVIQAKISTGQAVGTPVAQAPGAPTQAADLMAVLAQSVAEEKAKRTPSPAPRTRKPRATRAPAQRETAVA